MSSIALVVVGVTVRCAGVARTSSRVPVVVDVGSGRASVFIPLSLSHKRVGVCLTSASGIHVVIAWSVVRLRVDVRVWGVCRRHGCCRRRLGWESSWSPFLSDGKESGPGGQDVARDDAQGKGCEVIAGTSGAPVLWRSARRPT